MNRVLFGFDGPKCLDGSPAGFYSQLNASSTKYVIYLEGGGVCETTADCNSRKNSALGSSKYWLASTVKGELLSPSIASNPDFYSWNHIYVPYCSGDLFLGMQVTPVNPFTTTTTTTNPSTTATATAHVEGQANETNGEAKAATFTFQGHLIVQTLVASYLPASTSDVLLTGCSAGGMGAFFHADYLREQLPKAVVKANPEAGWFGKYKYDRWPYFVAGIPDPDPTHIADTSVSWLKRIQVYNCTASQACYSDPLADPTYCDSIPYFYTYIKTPVFVTESGADSYQVEHQGAMPLSGGPANFNATQKAYVIHFGDELRASLRLQIVEGPKATTDGLFTPACYAHCLPWNAKVSGVTWREALGNWYFGRVGPTQLLDPTEDVNAFLACT